MSADATCQSFLQKLRDLTNTQQSIQTLSLWVIYHTRRASSLIRVWTDEILKTIPSRLIAFLYLANDVIQNSRRKTAVFANEFEKILPTVVPFVFRNLRGRDLDRFLRVLSIWEDRRVFSTDFVRKLRTLDPTKASLGPALVVNTGLSSPGPGGGSSTGTTTGLISLSPLSPIPTTTSFPVSFPGIGASSMSHSFQPAAAATEEDPDAALLRELGEEAGTSAAQSETHELLRTFEAYRDLRHSGVQKGICLNLNKQSVQEFRKLQFPTQEKLLQHTVVELKDLRKRYANKLEEVGDNITTFQQQSKACSEYVEVLKSELEVEGENVGLYETTIAEWKDRVKTIEDGISRVNVVISSKEIDIDFALKPKLPVVVPKTQEPSGRESESDEPDITLESIEQMLETELQQLMNRPAVDGDGLVQVDDPRTRKRTLSSPSEFEPPSKRRKLSDEVEVLTPLVVPPVDDLGVNLDDMSELLENSD